MKKLLLLALVLLSISSIAQSVNDSTSVALIQNIQDTQQYVVEINNALRNHARLAVAGIACEAVGTVCLWYGNNGDYAFKDKHKTELASIRKGGAVFCIAGGVLFIASYVPLWRKELKVDERGITLAIPISK